MEGSQDQDNLWLEAMTATTTSVASNISLGAFWQKDMNDNSHDLKIH